MIIEERYLQTFDEIHNIVTEVRDNANEDEFLDWVESVLILGYKDGMDSTAEMLDMAIDTSDLPLDKLDKALSLVIDGKTYRDRIHEYWEGGSNDEIERVVATEYHRMFNEGGYTEAKELGATMKEWITVGDDKVRETHSYIEGMQVPIDARFYTFDNDSALAPGGFSNASNNVNCRCVVKYIR